MKKLLLKSLAFISLLIIAQTVVVYCLRLGFFGDYPLAVADFKKGMKDFPEVVFFGDSVVFTVDPDEPDRRTVSQLLQEKMPGTKILSVAHSAYNQGVYIDYLKYMIAHGVKPEKVVIEINLRSFSPISDRRPQYQFEKEKIFLANDLNPVFPLIYKPLLVLKYFNLQTISEVTFKQTPLYDGEKHIGTVADCYAYDEKLQREQAIQKVFQCLYLENISLRNRKLDDLINIAGLLRDHRIPVVFFITPIDYASGQKYFGDRFLWQINKNVSFVKSSLENQGVVFADFSASLPSSHFLWLNEGLPDEHLDSFGRESVADGISKMISDEKGF